jgi:Ca2+-binding EF-hand superfamily protein
VLHLIACSDRLDKKLDDSELKEALTLLDVGKTGFVQFADFVEWFQGLRPDKATREKAASSQSTSTQD